MANKSIKVDIDNDPATLEVGGEALQIWSDQQDVRILNDDSSIFITWFEDTAKYHPALIDQALAKEKDEDWTHRMPNGGSKVRDLEDWGTSEADLLTARASGFFARAVGRSDVLITQSWANISRYGEFLTPHSHTDCIASMVYMLNWGDSVDSPPLSGRLSLADPRLAYCCPNEPGRVTRDLTPDMKDGALCIFPSEILHYVNPYWGKQQPRITIAWNFRFSGN